MSKAHFMCWCRSAATPCSTMFTTGLANCRPYHAPSLSLLRTLASTIYVHEALLSKHKHHHHHHHFHRCFCSPSSKNTTLTCASAKSNVASLVSTSSVNGQPEYHRLLPCPSHSSPPRIEHLVVFEGGPVSDYICKALNLPPLFVADLIHFGAVHYALVCPQPPPSATPEQMRVFKKYTDPSILKSRSSIKGMTVREAQKTFRITDPMQFVEEGTYLRVHVHPKRFPRCYEIDWKSRIMAVTDSYVVLDKPAGTSETLHDYKLPHAPCSASSMNKRFTGWKSESFYDSSSSRFKVGGTADNIEESCATFATRALGFTEPLKTTHQIDNCSEGCVVLARTKEYSSVFHGKIREKKVKKLYRALAAGPVPVGILSHYMRPVNMAPRLVSEEHIKGWHLCQLEVMECKKVPWPSAAVEEKYRVEDCGWLIKDFAFECKINLLTGKTHQIRAQLAACGAPIVGDSMYMPAAMAELAFPGINPFGKFKEFYANEDDREAATAKWIARHGKEPSVAIGLQAFQISWDEGEHIYEAGSPWWSQE